MYIVSKGVFLLKNVIDPKHREKFVDQRQDTEEQQQQQQQRGLLLTILAIIAVNNNEIDQGTLPLNALLSTLSFTFPLPHPRRSLLPTIFSSPSALSILPRQISNSSPRYHFFFSCSFILFHSFLLSLRSVYPFLHVFIRCPLRTTEASGIARGRAARHLW